MTSRRRITNPAVALLASALLTGGALFAVLTIKSTSDVSDCQGLAIIGWVIVAGVGSFSVARSLNSLLRAVKGYPDAKPQFEYRPGPLGTPRRRPHRCGRH